jgi:hypothetical protein
MFSILSNISMCGSLLYHVKYTVERAMPHKNSVNLQFCTKNVPNLIAGIFITLPLTTKPEFCCCELRTSSIIAYLIYLRISSFGLDVYYLILNIKKHVSVALLLPD